jgi:hypothetical protein
MLAGYWEIIERKSIVVAGGLQPSEFVGPGVQIGTDSVGCVVCLQVLEVPGCFRFADELEGGTS